MVLRDLAAACRLPRGFVLFWFASRVLCIAGSRFLTSWLILQQRGAWML